MKISGKYSHDVHNFSHTHASDGEGKEEEQRAGSRGPHSKAILEDKGPPPSFSKVRLSVYQGMGQNSALCDLKSHGPLFLLLLPRALPRYYYHLNPAVSLPGGPWPPRQDPQAKVPDVSLRSGIICRGRGEGRTDAVPPSRWVYAIKVDHGVKLTTRTCFLHYNTRVR